MSWLLRDVASGDRVLISRSLIRASAYAAAPLLLARGRRTGRVLAALGAGAYLSAPLVRARRRRLGLGAIALIPATLALKDLSKAAGGIWALALRRSPQ